MVVAPMESDYDKVARMPPRKSWCDEDESLQLLALQRFSSHQKPTRHIPRSNSRARHPKLSLVNSPRLTSRHLKSCNDCPPSPFLAPPVMSRSSSRELRAPSQRHQRTKSKDGTEPKVYRSEADFLIQNQRHFTQEDFQAVLAALAEESRMDAQFQKQEEESILLAQELAGTVKGSPWKSRGMDCGRGKDYLRAKELAAKDSRPVSCQTTNNNDYLLAHKLAMEDCEMTSSNRSSTLSAPSTNDESESDDLAALVVALRAELDETERRRKSEEESYRFACELVCEEAKECGIYELEKQETQTICNKDQSTAASFVPVQCQVCHFDIPKEEVLRELSCGHHFHAPCINRWFLTGRNDCPCCRRSV